MHFKVVCPRSSVQWWMWAARPPHVELSRSYRIGVGCFGCLVCMVLQRYFGKGTAWRLLFRCGAEGSSSDLCQRLVGVWNLDQP